MLGDDGYAEFRATLLAALAALNIVVDEAHIDHGVLHTPSGETMGLANIARVCHGAPRDQWPTVLADHLRRVTAKPVPLVYADIADKLRVRVTPDELVESNPEAFVARPLTSQLKLALAVDLPEHVVYVKQAELAGWPGSEDDHFARAMANTEAEPPLEEHTLELEDAPPLTVLAGGSYFAASHALFLERYLPHHPNGVLLGVPDRHALIVLPLVGVRSLGALGPLLRLVTVRFAEQPGSISDQLFWRRGARWIRIPCGMRPDGTPWVAPPDEFNTFVQSLAPAE